MIGAYWCGWLAVMYAAFAVSAATRPDLWGTGGEALAAYRVALDAAPADAWAVLWGVTAVAAFVAAVTRRLEPARAALAASVLGQGIWTVSVATRMSAHGVAYLPATFVWASPLVVSGVLLVAGLVDPAARFIAHRVDDELLEELRSVTAGGDNAGERAA